MLPLGAEIFLQENHNSGTNYYDYYSKAGVTVIPFKPIPKWIMNIPKVRAFIMMQHQKETILKYIPFDVIINMFVSSEMLSQVVSYREKGTRTYAYFCGSDIIRASKLDCLRLKLDLKKIDGVICASSGVQDAYLQKIGKLINTPYVTIRLGMSSFDFINSKLSGGHKDDYKTELNIDPKKTTICIGYNASVAQNHLPVLEQFRYLPKAILNKVTILLQMTYGGDKEYITNVESVVSELGCDYKLFREYMNISQITQLRLATDIFINAQATDGLSGSVLEALYAGATLLNASWLQYKEYAEWGISYKSFSEYEEIPKLLIKVLTDISETKDKNRDILKNQMSWEQCRDAWERLLY